MLNPRVLIGCSILGLFLSSLANGQQGSPTPIRHTWADDCAYEGSKIVCSFKEDRPQAIGPLKVDNSSEVVIRVTNKSPFDDCTLGEIKTTEIKTPDPIATILQLLTKAVTGAALPSSALTQGDNIKGKTTKTPADVLYSDLMTMKTAIDNEANDAANLVDENLTEARNLDKLFSNPPRNKSEYDDPSPTNRVSVADLKNALKGLLNEGEPSLESEQLQQGLLRDRLKDILSKGQQDRTDIDTIKADEEIFDYLSGRIAAIKANYDGVSAAHATFRQALAFLDQIDEAVKASASPGDTSKNPFQKHLPIPPFTQQSATTSVSCSNSFSKKATTPQIAITIAYQKEPRLSVSVGPLLSTIEKQKLGTTPISTGLDSSGKPTFKLVFAVVDHASIQVVPFAFLNYRFLDPSSTSNPAKKRSFSLNASVGVGINPNSGTNEPEFFFGPGIGFKNLMVQLGDHIGRFQKGFTGGFQIGDTVPANFPSSLPIHKVYRHGFGLALSYRLPL